MTFNVPVTKMPSTNVLNEFCVKITLLRSDSEKNKTVSNAVYLRLCIDLIYTTPPFGIPRVMGAIISLDCNWWSNMHQIDA